MAALIALLQLDYARQGRPSPLAVSVTTVSAYVQLAATTVANGIRNSVWMVGNLPQLFTENTRLRAENAHLNAENLKLTEALARVPAERDIALAQMKYPAGVASTVIGYDPEAALHVITIDRGGKDRIARDDGVVTDAGVVGRVVEVAPVTSKVLLLTDVTSRLPAIVQRGRWWSISVGTQTRLKLQYVSQDAKLKVGDKVVTGEGRSFHAGIAIGHITHVEPAAAGALDQSAIVQPAVDFGSISRVLVLPK
ncbi:MAG: rod shape-determining protein MreC [Candidatus Velthaea sp.]